MECIFFLKRELKTRKRPNSLRKLHQWDSLHLEGNEMVRRGEKPFPLRNIVVTQAGKNQLLPTNFPNEKVSEI
jgi:hypothetical protein